MKILGIDYGEKKVGLSLSAGNIALPWKILNNFRSNQELVREIKKIIKEEKIEAVVIGLPLSCQNKFSTQTWVVKEFIKFFKKNITIPLFIVDELFSSQMAQKQLAGKNDDAQAAANILQTYLDNQLN